MEVAERRPPIILTSKNFPILFMGLSLHHPSHSLTLPCPPPLSTRTEKEDPMCPRKGSSEVGVGERSLDLLKLAPLGGGPARWVT